MEDFDDIRNIIRKRRLTPEERDIIVQQLNASLESIDGLNNRIHELYFENGMTQKEVAEALGLSRTRVQTVFKRMGWKGRSVDRAVDSTGIRTLHDDEHLTQKEIADKLGVSRAYVYKILRESRKADYSRRSRRIDFDLEKAYHLYCEKGLSQREIARELGIGRSTFGNRVRELGWEKAKPEVIPIDVGEIHRLYFEEGLSRKEVASTLGISQRKLKSIFKEMGWKAGPRGAVLNVNDVLCFRNEEGRSISEIGVSLGVSRERIEQMYSDIDEKDKLTEHLEHHGSNSQRLEARRLREHIFGKECNVCNVSQDERMLALHRKDGTLHERELVWNPRSLRDLNPEDWMLLCPPCHRSVHWSMDQLSVRWDSVERITRERNPLNQMRRCLDFGGKRIRELRFELFDDECAVCGRNKSEKKLVLHRKNGEYHHRQSTWTKKFLRTVVIDDWVMLCDRCHLGVHWYMDNFGIAWNQIISLSETGEDT